MRSLPACARSGYGVRLNRVDGNDEGRGRFGGLHKAFAGRLWAPLSPKACDFRAGCARVGCPLLRFRKLTCIASSRSSPLMISNFRTSWCRWLCREASTEDTDLDRAGGTDVD